MNKKTVKKKINSFGYKIANKYIGVLFEKFSKVLPIKRIEENEKAIAFYHPKPDYQEHILITPKKAIKNLSSFSNSDLPFVQDCFKLAKMIIRRLNWEKKEYRLIVNGGENQKIKQLHFHLIMGRETNT